MGLFRKAVTTLASNMGLTDPRLMAWIGGEPTPAGESVSVQTSLQLDAVWACARLVATTIATLPVVLYERGASQNTVATAHPLYRVIHDRPNADMTAVEFWTAMVACKLMWGNAYAAVTKRSDGSVISLDPLRSDRVRMVLQQDGSRTYQYSYLGVMTVYQEEDLLILKGFSLDGITGMSAISFGRNSLGIAMGAERTAGSIFKNALRPSGYFKIPQFLSKEQRQKARSYVDGLSGSGNVGKVPMVEGGWEFQAFAIPPNDAQLLETRSFNIETICRWFGVPPSLIGHTEKTTSWGTGLEQINLAFLIYTLRSHLKEIEQAISVSLLPAGERGLYYAEFNVEGLLRADSQGRAAYYQAMVNFGLMTPNEIRALENLPPLPGGENLFMQGAMMPVQQLVAQAKAAAEKVKLDVTTAGALPRAEPGVSRDAGAVTASIQPASQPNA